jgi:cobalt/nickel transport system ATP-binding protein
MEVIKLEKIWFEYQEGIRVFEGLDLSLMRGERVGIVGPNGSGKTTFFSLLMGLKIPQKGDVCLFGKRCSGEEDFKSARKKIGYLFQDPDDQVFCPTVLEDIAFGPLNLGVDPVAAVKRSRDIAGELGIAHLAERISTRLSWGQKKLVALAGVLAMEPEILILDEPTASIDDNIIDFITKYLRGLKCSMLITSHDRKFLNDICGEIYFLDKGILLKKS